MKNVIIILVFVVLAGIGLYKFVGDDTSAPSPSPSPTATRTSTPTPTATSTPSGTPAKSATHQVAIQNFAFSPASLTVKKGDKVVFTNKDSAAHTATGDFGDSGTLRKDEVWTLNTATLNPGTYAYKCNFHPSMRGTLIIQ